MPFFRTNIIQRMYIVSEIKILSRIGKAILIVHKGLGEKKIFWISVNFYVCVIN